MHKLFLALGEIVLRAPPAKYDGRFGTDEASNEKHLAAIVFDAARVLSVRGSELRRGRR